MQNKNGVTRWQIVVIFLLAITILGSGVYFWQFKIGTLMQDITNNEATLLTPLNNATLNELPQNTQSEVQEQKLTTTLQKIKTEGARTYFDGNITVGGKFQEWSYSDFMGGILCFYPDDKTGYLIPRGLIDNENGVDTRIPWFCFENQLNAKQLLGITNDVAIFSDETIACIEGKATIEISNYVVTLSQREAWDTANLKKVISKEKYATKCDSEIN